MKERDKLKLGMKWFSERDWKTRKEVENGAKAGEKNWKRWLTLIFCCCQVEPSMFQLLCLLFCDETPVAVNEI